MLAADLPTLQASLWSHAHADWAATFAVNTTAHYFLVVALAQLLAAGATREVEGGLKGSDVGCGCVVITSSCASMHNCTNVDLTSYAASKAATDHLVAMLAAKFARWYVRVNGINPGCEFLRFSVSLVEDELLRLADWLRRPLTCVRSRSEQYEPGGCRGEHVCELVR